MDDAGDQTVGKEVLLDATDDATRRVARAAFGDEEAMAAAAVRGVRPD